MQTDDLLARRTQLQREVLKLRQGVRQSRKKQEEVLRQRETQHAQAFLKRSLLLSVIHTKKLISDYDTHLQKALAQLKQRMDGCTVENATEPLQDQMGRRMGGAIPSKPLVACTPSAVIDAVQLNAVLQADSLSSRLTIARPPRATSEAAGVEKLRETHLREWLAAADLEEEASQLPAGDGGEAYRRGALVEADRLVHELDEAVNGTQTAALDDVQRRVEDQRDRVVGAWRAVGQLINQVAVDRAPLPSLPSVNIINDITTEVEAVARLTRDQLAALASDPRPTPPTPPHPAMPPMPDMTTQPQATAALATRLPDLEGALGALWTRISGLGHTVEEAEEAIMGDGDVVAMVDRSMGTWVDEPAGEVIGRWNEVRAAVANMIMAG